jgi:16S rRNA (guanine(966)-N(2))-methyltransferase RsmD
MRVLAGELKGQRLVTPKGRTTRPTADQVRIACLDTLMPYLEAGPFLDLFAGAGGVGIEGLSRGAPSAVFVDEDRGAIAALADNVKRLGLGGRARIIRADVTRALATLASERARFAVVFLDPPYDSLQRGNPRPARRGRLSRSGGHRGRAASHQGAARAGQRSPRTVEEPTVRGDDLDFLSGPRVE